MSDAEGGSRSRRNRHRRGVDTTGSSPHALPLSGIVGGRYQPLKQADLPRIDQAVRSILRDVGMAEAPEIVIDRVTAAGGSVDQDGRLRFSTDLIESALAGIARGFKLCGQNPAHDIQLGDKRVHVGSGGAAPLVLDLDTGHYRESYLRDLYDAARLVDNLEHFHFFSRSMVARDMPDLHSLDINPAYACLTGTSKHVFVAAR